MGIINCESTGIVAENLKFLTQTMLPISIHGINPRTLMGDEDWNKMKIEVQNKANFHCRICGDYISHTFRRLYRNA